MSDKRNFSRVDFETRGELLYKSKSIPAKVKNLSLKGAFFETNEKITVGEEISVKIFLVGGTSDLTIAAKGKIIRNDAEGVALNFIEISIDSFVHLKNIIQYNTGAPEQILTEFREYIKHTLEKNK